MLELGFKSKGLAIVAHCLPEEAFHMYLWKEGWIVKDNYLGFIL